MRTNRVTPNLRVSHLSPNKPSDDMGIRQSQRYVLLRYIIRVRDCRKDYVPAVVRRDLKNVRTAVVKVEDQNLTLKPRIFNVK